MNAVVLRKKLFYTTYEGIKLNSRMDDLSQFQDLFYESAEKHIGRIKVLLEELIKLDNSEKLKELHLHLHSLKGEIYAMQYNNFGDYVTILEKYIKGIIEKNGRLGSESSNLLQSEIRMIQTILDKIKNEYKEPEDIVTKSENLRKVLGIL